MEINTLTLIWTPEPRPRMQINLGPGVSTEDGKHALLQALMHLRGEEQRQLRRFDEIARRVAR